MEKIPEQMMASFISWCKENGYDISNINSIKEFQESSEYKELKYILDGKDIPFEDDNGDDWIDPAGGLHYYDDDDPSSMYI